MIINYPGTFQQALQDASIRPGDCLHLRGGTYRGDWTVNIGGTAEAPVIIKPYKNEPVVIDGSITFGKSFVRVMDMEITDRNPDRAAETPCITMNQRGCELVGCHIHGLHGSGVYWFGPEGRVSECWIHGNGYLDAAGKGHGHAIYSHNHQGGTHRIERNLLERQVGNYTIHIFSGGNNYLKDFTCLDNVIDGWHVHTGGGLGLIDFVYQRNIQYGGVCQQGKYSMQPNIRATIDSNLFINMVGLYVDDAWQELTETRNTVWGSETWSRSDGYAIEAKPVNWSKFIPFSLSERWSGIRCQIVDGVFSAAIE